MKAPVSVFILMCAVALSTCAWAGREPDVVLKPGTYPTKWVTETRDKSRYTNSHIHWSHARNSPLKGIWPSVKKPEFESDYPFRRCGKIGDILYALDGPRGVGEGVRKTYVYNRLYLDLNDNNDLTDDPVLSGVLEAPGPDGLRWMRFPDVTVPVARMYPGSMNPNSGILEVSVSEHHLYPSIPSSAISENPGVFSVVLRGVWEGEIESNLRRIPFRLRDTTGNDRYDDKHLWRFDAAGSYMDKYGDEIAFDWSGTGHYEQLGSGCPSAAVSSAVNIGGELYQLRPAPMGDELTVSLYHGPTATVDYKLVGLLDSKVDAKVSLRGESARYSLDDERSSLKVPVGTYMVRWIKLNARDETGTDWGLTYSNRSPFNTEAGQTHTIPLGGKIILTIATDTDSSITVKHEGEDAIPLRLELSTGGDVRDLRRDKKWVGPVVTVESPSREGLTEDKTNSGYE